MGVLVKWLAHAGFQIKADGKTVYVDLEKYGEASEIADLILHIFERFSLHFI